MQTFGGSNPRFWYHTYFPYSAVFLMSQTPDHPEPGWGWLLIIFLGGVVLPGPENPYPISDQNI